MSTRVFKARPSGGGALRSRPDGKYHDRRPLLRGVHGGRGARHRAPHDRRRRRLALRRVDGRLQPAPHRRGIRPDDAVRRARRARDPDARRVQRPAESRRLVRGHDARAARPGPPQVHDAGEVRRHGAHGDDGHRDAAVVEARPRGGGLRRGRAKPARRGGLHLPGDRAHAEEAMRKVALVGAGVSKFGVRKASYRDLIWEAGKACFDSVPGVKPRDLEGLVVGSVMPERTAFQSHIASLAAEALGIKPSALSARTEHMCASGTVGIRYAYAFIAAGLADLIMVLGVEKLNQPSGDEAILNMGTGVDREWEAALGLTAPPCFALAAQRHMAAYGTTDEQLALVGVKNHTHASKNPNAHFNKGATLDQVLGSRMISSPLRLFMCSPITDGAAAVIVASEERARDLTDRPVWIRGSGQALDGFQLTSLHEDYAHWPAMKRAAESAYRAAGVGPTDVDVAEVHDCFSIAELIAYDGRGFCAKGEAGPFMAAGRSDYRGDVGVNPRGRPNGRGHPLGATGVAQAAEIWAQLRGDAGARQVPDATIGLTHNNSGMGEHIVMIYGTEPT